MAVLFLKNHRSEGHGTIGDFLAERDVPFCIVELGSGEIPPSLEQFDTLVVLGGPMGVYEMDRYPHLMIASRSIREAMNRDIKILGVCLGAQLVAHCLGAPVYKGPEVEIGWRSIELAGDGLRDTLFRNLAIHPGVGDFWKRFKVFHWHGDTFDLPLGAVLLASSERYRNQAFRHGNRTYGFQFHIEVTKDMLLEWCEDNPQMIFEMEETERIYEEYAGRAMNFYRAFFGSDI
jgi:GMP synthase (glutamine-hydrolysing)